MTAALRIADNSEPFKPYLLDVLDEVRRGREALLFLLNLPEKARRRFPEDYGAAIDYVGRQLAADICIAQETLEIQQQHLTGELPND
jgi:hypothetical protein